MTLRLKLLHATKGNTPSLLWRLSVIPGQRYLLVYACLILYVEVSTMATAGASSANRLAGRVLTDIERSLNPLPLIRQLLRAA